MTAYSAWLTTTTDCLDGDLIDVSVLHDTAGGDPLFYATTTVTVDGDHDDAQSEAEDLLTRAGWWPRGTWEPQSSGYTIAVERTD